MGAGSDIAVMRSGTVQHNEEQSATVTRTIAVTVVAAS